MEEGAQLNVINVDYPEVHHRSFANCELQEKGSSEFHPPNDDYTQMEVLQTDRWALSHRPGDLYEDESQLSHGTKVAAKAVGTQFGVAKSVSLPQAINTSSIVLLCSLSQVHVSKLGHRAAIRLLNLLLS
jgi:hypothetical protein